jgi:hypothetical protein
MTYTDEQVEALADAMEQLLDDMGERGAIVCIAAKAQARIAYEPFARGNAKRGVLPAFTLEQAKKIMAQVDGAKL